MTNRYAKIIGTGSHNMSSDIIVSNEGFNEDIFYDATGKPIEKPTTDIIRKFEEELTGIKQRHYAAPEKVTSTLATEAGENAIISSGINREEIDIIIVANNFGDVANPSDKVDLVPSYAARIKNHLGIQNPNVIAYDIEYGGPGDERSFKMFTDYLGLNDKEDLIIYVNDHEQEDILEVAEYTLPNCSVDRESLNSIVVVHYLGRKPSIAHKVKSGLKIQNPNVMTCVIYFGCPGFLQAMILADTMIKRGKITTALIIGAEILSRVADKRDIDKLLYADAGAAVILKAVESETPVGILFSKVRSDTLNQQAFMIWMGKSYDPNHDPHELFLKMQGRRVHKHALTLIPPIIKDSLKEAGLQIEDISKMIFHQPNPFMLKEIALRTFAQFDQPVPENIMPIIGDTYGNSSVACIPLILDLIFKGKLEGHTFKSGDIIMFLSIGAGMNINIAYYKVP